MSNSNLNWHLFSYCLFRRLGQNWSVPATFWRVCLADSLSSRLMPWEYDWTGNVGELGFVVWHVWGLWWEYVSDAVAAIGDGPCAKTSWKQQHSFPVVSGTLHWSFHLPLKRLHVTWICLGLVNMAIVYSSADLDVIGLCNLPLQSDKHVFLAQASSHLFAIKLKWSMEFPICKTGFVHWSWCGKLGCLFLLLYFSLTVVPVTAHSSLELFLSEDFVCLHLLIQGRLSMAAIPKVEHFAPISPIE